MLVMENKVSRNWNNFFLGLVVAVLPWLAIPLGFKNVVFTILGLLIALFSLANPLARRLITPESHDSTPTA